MTHTVYISDDYDLKETMDNISAKLTERGIQVIRGPKTIKGIKLVIPPEEYKKYFADAEVALFSSRSVCPAELISYAPKLRGLVCPTIGTESLDMKTANERGIIVGNGACPENYLGMAEANVLLTLMLMYNPNKCIEIVKKNLPKPVESQHWAHLLWKKTIGVIGFGRIGRAYAERLKNFDLRILVYDPYVKAGAIPPYATLTDMDTLLAESDLVDVFLPVNDETRDMVNYEFLSKMKPSAYFINTSRGQLVDEDGICRVLREKRIAGAALDTYKVEPLPMDSPLREFDNLILTPHLIGHTLENQLVFADIGVENITRILNGELPLYCVNPKTEERWRERLAILDKTKS
ncbi:MAG: 2-hydroxyacid dehydrogenase [Eubacteriales bacterium]